MDPPCEFDYLDGYAAFRPSGDLLFYDAVRIISQGIALAANEGIKRLLVDTTKLTGFPYPTTWERFFMAEQWAKNSRGLRLSVVARPDLIDPFRYGVQVARNRGLFAEVFTSEPEAVEWILHPNPE